MSDTTRRRMLGAAGLGGLVAATGAGIATGEATPPHADAELLAACDRYRQSFNHVEATIRAQGVAYGWDLPDSACDLQGELLDRLHEHGEIVRDIPASTPEGIRAKAKVVWLDDGALPGKEPDTLIFSLLRDLGGDAA